MTDTGKGVAGCLAIVIMLPFSAMLNGLALSILWSWFMVPTFHLTAIGVAEAGGISLVIGMVTYHDCATDKDRAWWVFPAIMIARPLMALLIGSIWKSFL